MNKGYKFGEQNNKEKCQQKNTKTNNKRVIVLKQKKRKRLGKKDVKRKLSSIHFNIKTINFYYLLNLLLLENC